VSYLELSASNMALQRTRRPRLRSGRSLRSLGSPLNARPLGHTKVRFPLIALVVVVVIVAACSTATGPTLLAYQTRDGVWRQGGRGVVAPVPEELAPPDWPPQLRTSENTGQVLLDIEVSAHGAVERAAVTQSVSEWSDAEAVRTVKRWRYRPATRHGVPVAVRMKACVTFRRG
jgi:TonB family protein